MSNASADDDGAEGPAEGRPAAARREKMLPLIAGGVMVFLLAGGGGAYFGGLLDGVLGGDAQAATGADETAHHEPKAEVQPTFYALPEMLVSLNTGERRATFLKLKVSLELADPQDSARIEQVLPRVVDYCQVYLRELRVDEVRGSAGMARLREELLRRIDSAVAPVPVKDVLFSDIYIQ